MSKFVDIPASGNWNYPSSIRFGAGRLKELTDACGELGITKPLIVTDPGLVGLPIISEAAEILEKGAMTASIFSDVQGNPVEENVNNGVAMYRSCNNDGVIAFGGGSALDAGKAVALMVGQNRPIWDFEDRDDWYTRVNVEGMAPVVAIPTTSGTGSEVGRASVITRVEDHTKKIIFHPNMLPARVILDPEVTVGLPAHLTAAVGMDALSHCLEAWCSPVYHPMAQGIALEGMKLIDRWLGPAVSNGSDLDARGNMQVASTMGSTAFQKGLGAMHSLSHPCGAVLNTHHGLTNAVVMPYVLQFNRSAIEDKLQDLSCYLGLPTPGFGAVMEWVLRLREQLAIPHTLKNIGVDIGHIETLAPMAVVDPSSGTNPVALTIEGASGLYESAIEGLL